MLIFPITTWVLAWRTLEAARRVPLGSVHLIQLRHSHPVAANAPNKPLPTGTTVRYRVGSESVQILAPCSHGTGVSHMIVWVRVGGPDVSSMQLFPTVRHKTRCCFCSSSRALQCMLTPTGAVETSGVSVYTYTTHLRCLMGANPAKTFWQAGLGTQDVHWKL